MARVYDSDFVSGKSCIDVRMGGSWVQEIIDFEGEQETVFSVAECDVESSWYKLDSVSRGSILRDKEQMTVSLVEKDQEIEEERTASISGLENGVEGKFKHSFSFSVNGVDNPVNIEKEVLLFSEVHEFDKSDHSMKPSEDGLDSISEDPKKMVGDSILEPQKPIGVINSATKCGKSSDTFLGMQEMRSLIDSELGFILEAGNADNPAWDVKVKQGMVGSDGDCRIIPVMLGPSVVGSGYYCGKKGNGGQMYVKKDGTEGKRDKFSKRWVKGMKKVSDANGNQNVLSFASESRNVYLKGGARSKIAYSRKDLEALRFVNVGAQQIVWNEVYHGLGSFLAQELEGMTDSKHQKQGNRNVEHHQGVMKRKENLAILTSTGATKGKGNRNLQVYVR